MNYIDFGLQNTKEIFSDALKNNYAVPAFNFYNMETFKAILAAARITNSPVILAVSPSALKYMGANILMGIVRGANFNGLNIVLHLDHGGDFEVCKVAIDMGFSSVMIDASAHPFEKNIEITKRVCDYARDFNVSVEAELGTLSGVEDENTQSEFGIYTNPDDAVKFVQATGIDSLAIAIGTSHGAYKRKNESEELRFDILSKIAELLPNFPLVLHGASNIPEHLVDIINKFGGSISGARGIPAEQIRRAASMNICKVNVDSDSRLAFTAAVREKLFENPEIFDPRFYLKAAIEKMTETYIWDIKNRMGSEPVAAPQASNFG